MSKGETRFELILLFRDTGLEPKKLGEFLKSKGQNYPYSTLKKYAGYYAVANNIERSILTGGKK